MVRLQHVGAFPVKSQLLRMTPVTLGRPAAGSG